MSRQCEPGNHSFAGAGLSCACGMLANSAWVSRDRLAQADADLAAARAEIEGLREAGGRLSESVLQVSNLGMPHGKHEAWVEWECQACRVRVVGTAADLVHEQDCPVSAWRALARPERGSVR